ncbi:MAG: shikimate dehydrogenase [Bacillota bacterium]|nr:shikimate dehydrogenase [Bacillota bacterium]
MKYGLLGERLKHSLSPEIHALYGNDDYELIEVAKDKAREFITAKNYKGVNVTIPYKELAFELCDEVSPKAAEIGSVNTIIVREDNSLYGDNTDYYGFLYMASTGNIEFRNKKVVIMGSGGTGKTAYAAVKDNGAKEIVILSRRDGISYEDKEAYRDADILINTTPVGMYPHNGEKLVDIKDFSNLEGVLDVVYNPLRTALLLQAEELKIPYAGGLPMLTEQARRGAEMFLSKSIPPEVGDKVYIKIRQRFGNIVVVGNESIAMVIGAELRRPVVTGGNWEDIAKEKSLILSVSEAAAKKHHNALRQNGVFLTDKVLQSGKARKIENILRKL